jgi:hypothetical protein
VVATVESSLAVTSSLIFWTLTTYQSLSLMIGPMAQSERSVVFRSAMLKRPGATEPCRELGAKAAVRPALKSLPPTLVVTDENRPARALYSAVIAPVFTSWTWMSSGAMVVRRVPASGLVTSMPSTM